MLLKKFDFLSPNITLYYKNQRRHSSYLGGLLTILMIILSIIIIVHYSFIKVYPSPSSLLIYRNYDKDFNIHFNKTEYFHYLWIFNEKNLLDNNLSQNLIQLNNIRKGLIRIYMTYSYDKYEYNASNLKDNDHWVYDTCSSYADNDDFKYDYSFSSCIKYYYNSDNKKYYSINDNTNFKWPFIKQNIPNYENTVFGIFVEKCENNSILNEILGECYPEEKINEYLYYFNNIFLSFINSKFQTNNKSNPVKLYSHKIYDKLNTNKLFFYIHDLVFIPFSYRGSNGLISKSKDYSSFILDEDKAYEIHKINNNKLLMAYILHYKKYVNEFRQKNNNFTEVLTDIGGSIIIIYILFYGFNYILNENIIIRNFQMFLNDKNNDLIHRHINYERNKVYSLKSNEKTNLSNELINKNEGYNSFKSTYFGNLFRNDLSNLTNLTNINNNFTADEHLNQKNNNNTNNNYTIKINRIDNEDSGNKKSDNIIVINNNSFMNDNSNNKIISGNSLEKYNSLKLINRYNNLENLQGYHKTYTYNKSSYESQSVAKLKAFIKNNKDYNNTKDKNYSKVVNIESINSKRNDSPEFNSRQKIIDTSSISLLNSNNPNKIQNLFISSSYNNDYEEDSPHCKFEKLGLNAFTKHNSKIQTSSKILPKQKSSFKQLNNRLKLINNYSPSKNSKKENRYTVINLSNNGRRRKSYQIKNNEKTDNINDKYKSRKAKTRKTGAFLKLPENNNLNNKEERHLSLFSKRSVINNDNIVVTNEKNIDNNSINVRKSLASNLKRFSPTINPKRKSKRQSSEFESKSVKRNKMSTIKNLNLIPKNEGFVDVIKNYRLSSKNLCYYICFCNTRGNSNYILNNFRKKMLSEEYLYILHINMFIFKQKYGCKSNLDQLYLLEELYNDF